MYLVGGAVGAEQNDITERHGIRRKVSYILGAFAIFNFWMAGSSSRNKRLVGWCGGFLSQFLWAHFAISIKQYGLLAMSFLYACVYARNFIKTKRNQDR